MIREKQTTRSSSKVESIETEYTRTLQHKADLKRVQKVRLYKRLAVFGLIALLTFSVLTVTFINQKKVLAAKQEEREMLLLDLANTEENQQLLTEQLEKLNDDEYIAKLAREQYFLSEKYEIIFSMPKNSENGKKKESEKE